MKNLLCFISFLLCGLIAKSQDITLSGACVSGTIGLYQMQDPINGKPAYQATGTVDGTDNVTVSIYWLGAPDNIWVIDYDGQPY